MQPDPIGMRRQGADPIRVLIVDHEPLARERIANLLDGREDTEVIAALGDGRRALAIIEADRPEVVFLGLELPELDGFALIERLEPPGPQLIVVTAHEHHALRAFEAEVVDFLLKPFSRQRLDAAFHRAARRVRRDRSERIIRQLVELSQMGNGTHRLPAAPAPARELPGEDEEPRSLPLRKLVVRDGSTKVLIDAREIDWVEAADYYATIHVGKRTHLIRRSLNWLERHLDQRRFIRIHRSSIVNVDRVREIRPWSGGSHDVLLQDGTELRLSASRRRELESLLGQSL